jgi:tetratricopeptide (TPR) repeat protein
MPRAKGVVTMRWSSLALLLFAGLVLTAGIASADMVKKADGTWLVDKPAGDVPTAQEIRDSKIKVLRESFDKLDYKFKTLNVTQSIPMSEVGAVYYEDKDPNYDRGIQQVNAGRLEDALASFERAIDSSVAWVPQYAMWEIVQVFKAAGETDRALQAIEDLLEKFSRTKFLVPAHKEAGLIYLQQKGDARRAETEFRKITSIPGVSETESKEVDYWLIFIQETRAGDNRGGINAAKSKYEQLLREVDGKSGLKKVEILARLGIGRCLLKTGAADEALSYFENIARSANADDRQTLAGAYIGIGDCYFAQDKWVDARRAYLRVAILWDDQGEFHAKALCLAGNCFLLARDQDYKRRAYQELRRCMEWYPGTYWAGEAEKLIGQTR